MPLFPLCRVPFKGPFSSRFSLLSRRFFYGYISDSKMAPQLEPFFKQ